MKNYIPAWDAIGIKKERYLELLHFCRQYPDWKTEAASLLGVHGQALNGMPPGSGVGDPVAAAAARRAGLLRKIQLVDDCASAVERGRWYTALIQNVCMSRPYRDLDPIILPTTFRNSFFKARRAFFIALDAAKDSQKNDET